MRLINKKMLVALSMFFFSSISYSADFDKVVVFGDSLSDSGNFYALSKKLHAIDPSIAVLPASPPYYQGRFSNGPTWAEDLASLSHVPLLNYAYGGAWAESESVSHQIIPSLNWQIDTYLFSHLFDKKANTLYIIWIGANDYFNNRGDINTVTNNVVAMTQKAIEKLIKFGATTIVTINLPDLGETPSASIQGPVYATMLTKLTMMHNQKLADMLQNEQHGHLNAKINLIDIASIFTNIINDPSHYGLTEVTNSCYDGGFANEAVFAKLNKRPTNAYVAKQLSHASYHICDNPDTYLFWDYIHPTAKSHQIIASLVANAIYSNE